MEEKRNIYRILVGRTEGNRSCGRYTSRKKDNIKLNLRDIKQKDVDWSSLSLDR
jgi:hypothetical protein